MGHEKKESDSISKDLFNVYYYKYKFFALNGNAYSET